jgi:hypothetical protein
MATIGGKWVGLGLGDASDEVGNFRNFIKRKFRSRAGNLPDTRTPDGVPLFDEPMAKAVLEIQRAYVLEGKLKPEEANSFVNNATKVALGYLRAPDVDIRPMMFTVCGTGVPWWVGPDADMARSLENIYKWQPIGYPAAPFPMGKSIKEGKAELRNQLSLHREQIERNGAVLCGYSQGAVITSEVWEFDIKPDNGAANWAKQHIKKAVTFGNPSRELGKVWPDFAPDYEPAPANTSGVAHPSERLKDTPSWWRDYAHKGDLYACCTQDESGEDKTAIWRIIRGEKFFLGPDTLLEQFLEVAKQPLIGAIGAFKAMWDAMSFIGKKTGPHISYNPWTAADYLRTGR